jgi:hypothetical protein
MRDCAYETPVISNLVLYVVLLGIILMSSNHYKTQQYEIRYNQAKIEQLLKTVNRIELQVSNGRSNEIHKTIK